MSTVAILLSLYNGERFLAEQVASYRTQTWTDWRLYWRDDGSSDGSRALMAALSRDWPDRIEGPLMPGHLGVAGSFLALLRAALDGPADCFAFSDQDDVWLPEKLAHGVAALAALPEGRPGLYFCRRALVDVALRPIGESPSLRRRPCFASALIQNVAPGCTLMLNRAAARLVADSPPPEDTWHDWWACLVVAAHDGAMLAGEGADILYRQHGANAVGEGGSLRRCVAALARVGGGEFFARLRRHVDALRALPGPLPRDNARILTRIAGALDGGIVDRIRASRVPGLVRQSALETAIFRIFFVAGAWRRTG